MISFFDRGKSPEEVFTPRSAEVNTEMYINRPGLEASLMRAVRTGYHVVIYGDSGCGKSWLYKKVFVDQKIFFDILDFSASSSGDDVDLQILEMVANYDEWREVEREKSIEKTAAPGGVGVLRNDTERFERVEQSPLLRLMASMREAAGRKKAFLVLENIEHILDKPDVVAKIQNMLLALDDRLLAKHKIRLCLVGVPAEIKEVLAAGNKYQTISNRVVEIPEVDRLSADEVGLLAIRGLEQVLDYTIESRQFCISQIVYATDRVPQYVHDVCLHTAILAEDNALRVNPTLIDAAIWNWIESNSRQSYEFMCECLEGSGPISQAKARIVYAIAKCEHRRFQASEIEKIARRLFPKSLAGKRLQTLRILRDLSSGEKRLLKCDETRHVFRLVTPKLRPAMRAAVRVDGSENVRIRRL